MDHSAALERDEHIAEWDQAGGVARSLGRADVAWGRFCFPSSAHALEASLRKGLVIDWSEK
jgi:hypothetical protein